MKTNNILNLLDEYKVVIPPIQRDYAQGRNSGKIPYIRKKFIHDISEVLSQDDTRPLELDFIYGYEELDQANGKEVKVFKPLDGQQRLTTLFLLHWYISVKENKTEEAFDLLKKFSYSTRKSSRDFCEKLIQFAPKLNGESVRDQIVNQPWFFSSWLNDPTIQSMLVMLNSLEEEFKTRNNIWELLSGPNPKIIFHLLSMDDLGLPDDLYIKMNARGKSLTDFEHFKSRFSEILDEDSASYFNGKIDKAWSDLFWKIFKDKESKDIAQEVDRGFLSFFWFITDILIRKQAIIIKSEFWLDKVKTVYEDKGENVNFLFNAIDLFESLESKDNKEIYFNDLFYIGHEDFDENKTRIFYNNPQVNLFRKCVETYGYEDKKNSFSVGEQLMLYAFIYMSFNNSVDTKKFRFLRNIFSSSEDQLRNEYLGSFLYNDIELISDKFETILSDGKFTESSKLSRRQCNEEKEKQGLIKNNEDLKSIVYRLEDHHLLRGNISIFNFDSSIIYLANKFREVFKSGRDYFSISNAMLTISDYSQQYGSLRRYGNKTTSTWRDLLTQSENRKGFDNTKEIFLTYLNKLEDSKITNESIILEYLNTHESNQDLPKPFSYYKIKYPSFTFWKENQTNGFYHWRNYDNKHYDCYMLFRKQFNGRHWIPFLLELNERNEYCTIENYGDPIQYTKDDLILMIHNTNEGYKFASTDDFSEDRLNSLIQSGALNEDGVLLVDQDEQGFDIEDRIEKGLEFINTL